MTGSYILCNKLYHNGLMTDLGYSALVHRGYATNHIKLFILMKKADLLDRKILKVISVDARRSFKEIAAQCGVSRAAIHQRVVRMVQRGIIVGSGYQVNPKFLGFGTCTYIGIKLERGSLYKTAVARTHRNSRNCGVPFHHWPLHHVGEALFSRQ